MKITTGLAASICIVTLASCGLGKARQSVSQIDRGMTKSQIVGILGQPRNKNVQENNREVWEYLFQDQLSEATLAVNVTFEDGRVSKFDSKETAVQRPATVAYPVPSPPPPVITPEQYPTRPEYYPGRGYRDPYEQEAEARAFEGFYQDVRSLIYTAEQIQFIEEVARRSYFSTDQVARLARIFSTDDQRLHVLRILAPRLRDSYNAFRLIELFDYMGAREEARRIIEAYAPPMPRQYDPRYGGTLPQQEDFEEFVRGVERQTFTKDKIRYIRDAAQLNTFSVQQTSRLLKLFSWDKERLEVLTAIAPHLRDGYNAYRLIDLFDFMHAKEEARRILGFTQDRSSYGRSFSRGIGSDIQEQVNEVGRRIESQMNQARESATRMTERTTWYQPLLIQLRTEPTVEGRLNLLRIELRQHQLTTEQGIEILRSYFSSDDDRLSALELIAPRLSDPSGRARFLDLFIYSEGKARASSYLGL